MKKIYFLLIAVNSLFAQNPNWSNDVAKIVYENCASCHRENGIAPFRLTTFQDAVNHASGIANSISLGIMPPWTPDPNYKSFAHQRVMNQTDKNTVLQWIANNTPSGDLRFAPPAPTYNSVSQISPNLSVSTPTYTVTTNDDEYRNFEIPSGLLVTNFAKAIEVIPGNPQIVHHVLVFEDNSTNPINPTSIGGTGSSASKLLFGYTPGSQAYFTPVGTGLKLNANTRIIVQIHYAPGSIGMIDNTTVNFKTTTTTLREIYVAPVLHHNSMMDGPLFIPANQTRTFNEQYIIPFDATLLYVFPHMHRIGKSIQSYGITPLGQNIPFVNIPEWEFHWQDNFVFPNALKVPSGTTLRATAFYDNTLNNADNPNNPPINVSLGEGTNDEMMLVFFAFLPYQAGDENLIIDKRIIPAGATTFCEGQSVKLKAIEGIGYTYQWQKDGTPIIGATSSSYVASITGNYNVTIALNTNSATSTPITVITQPAPNATITPSGTQQIPSGGSLTLTANTGSSYSYQWFKNNEIIAGEIASSYIATTAGNYTVEVFNGCYNLSTATIVTSNLVTNVNDVSNKIILSPNPNKGIFNIKNAENSNLIIYNELGQIIKNDCIKSNDFQISLIQKGVYFIRITGSNGELSNKKVIIE
jgi:hypothetical protein